MNRWIYDIYVQYKTVERPDEVIAEIVIDLEGDQNTPPPPGEALKRMRQDPYYEVDGATGFLYYGEFMVRLDELAGFRAVCRSVSLV